MSNPETSHCQTKGGVAGHVLRRSVHILMIVIPIAYYFWGERLAHAWYMTTWQLVLVFLGLLCVYEILRIRCGWLLHGQRQHETEHISSMTWGIIAIAIVLIFSPDPCYAIPIISACAIGDPLLGELRAQLKEPWVAVSGVIVIAALWWLCGVWMPVAWWWPLVLAPLTVAAEWPCLQWIDDNALMMLVPLGLMIVLIG